MKMLMVNSGFVAPSLGTVFICKVELGSFSVGETVSAWSEDATLLGSVEIKTILEEKKLSALDRIEEGQTAGLKFSGDQKGIIKAGSQIVGKGQGFVDFNDISTYLWQPSEGEQLGLALQGGGMKGAFGVGGLTLLAKAKMLTPSKIQKIASASTGSLTGIVAARGDGEITAELARHQYLDLVNTRSLFKLRSAVTELMKKSPSIKKLIDAALFGEGLSASEFFDAIESEVHPFEAAGKGALSALGPFGTFGSFGLGSMGMVSSVLAAVNLPARGVIMAYASIEEDIEEIVENWKELLAVKRSLTTLEPVKDILLKILKPGPDGLFSIKLRMAVTDFNTGVTAYLTERGTILYPSKTLGSEGYDLSRYEEYDVSQIGSVSINLKKENKQESDEFRVMLINGALASGAFPSLFEPIEITFIRGIEPETHVFFDGGIRENMPLRILCEDKIVEQPVSPEADSDPADSVESNKNDEKINTIIAMYCSPMETTRVSDGRGPWGDQALRALGLTLDEVARTDSTFGSSLNRSDLSPNQSNSPNVLHVSPGQAPLGLIEVEPRLVGAAIWYGYMRTFDELWIVENVLQGEDVQKVHREKNQGANEQKLASIERIRTSSENVFKHLRSVLLAGRTLIGRSKYFDRNDGDWITYAEMRENPLEFDIGNAAPRVDSLAKYRRAKSDLLRALDDRFILLGKQSLPFDFNMNTEGTAFLAKEFYRQWDFLFDPRWQSPHEDLKGDVIKKAFSSHGPMERLRVHPEKADERPSFEGNAGSEIKDLKRHLKAFRLPDVAV